MKNPTCSLKIAFACCFFTGLSTVVQPQNFATVASAVLKVTATGCAGNGGLLDGRTATAFVWRDKNTAVTALHVVSGCSHINVWYQAAKVQKSAQVTKIYRDGDLALLTIIDPQSVSPLVGSDHPAALSEELQALGFPLLSPTMNSTTLHLRFGGHTLNDIIGSSETRALLISNRSPSLQLTVTNIEGHLLPGLSGAPVLNHQNQVVAIGDGGLENGTVGISWGIPIQSLVQLMASTEVADRSSVVSPKVLFAAETEFKSHGEVICSGITLTKLRTVLFSDIAASTDSPLGLQQLVNYFGVDPRNLQYDVYQHLPSGATMLVPAGGTLISKADGCTYSNVATPTLVMRLQIAPVNGDAQITQVAITQEITAGGGSPQNWVSDNSFTNVTPTTRADGLVVRRKAFIHIDPTLIGANTLPQDRYLFETLATRNGFEINTSILNNDSTVENNKKSLTCRLVPTLAGCDQINQLTDEWVRSVIAVHLATFPIG
jgi:hypothetical protein